MCKYNNNWVINVQYASKVNKIWPQRQSSSLTCSQLPKFKSDKHAKSQQACLDPPFEVQTCKPPAQNCCTVAIYYAGLV